MIKRKDFLEKFDSKLVCFFASFFVLNIFIYKKFEINKIGNDDKYISFIIIPSFILGLIATTVYYYLIIKKEKDFNGLLIQDTNKRVKLVIQFLFSWLLITFIYLFFSLKTMLDVWLKKSSEKFSQEIMKAEITNFYLKKGHYINNYEICYILNDKTEYLEVDFSLNSKFENKNPKDYYLELLTRKTDWNYYIIEDWNIEKKSDSIN